MINATSGAVNLIVDEQSAELTTTDGILHRPIDVVGRVRQPETYNDRLDVPGFLPIWGSLVLEKDRQVEGYLVFEVSKGVGFDTLRWAASDTVIIRY